MPVRLFSQPGGIIYSRLIAGYVYFEDIVSTGTIPIAEIVLDDILTNFGPIPTNWAVAGTVTPFLQITEYNIEAISAFQGNPSKSKLGQLGFGTTDYATSWEFVYNTFQRYQVQKLQLEPELTGFPVQPEDVGSPVERDFVCNILTCMSPGVLYSSDITTIIDTIFYDMQPTVFGRLIGEYVCGCLNPLNFGYETLGLLPY